MIAWLRYLSSPFGKFEKVIFIGRIFRCLSNIFQCELIFDWSFCLFISNQPSPESLGHCDRDVRPRPVPVCASLWNEVPWPLRVLNHDFSPCLNHTDSTLTTDLYHTCLVLWPLTHLSHSSSLDTFHYKHYLHSCPAERRGANWTGTSRLQSAPIRTQSFTTSCPIIHQLCRIVCVWFPVWFAKRQLQESNWVFWTLDSSAFLCIDS